MVALTFSVLIVNSQRVVSLAPSITDIIIDLGEIEKVVGVTVYDDQEATRNIPKVGGWIDPNVEIILNLKPDLVLMTKAQEKFLGERLQKLRIPYKSLRKDNISDILDAIDSIGRWLSVENKAQILRGKIVSKIREYKGKIRGRKKIKAIFIVDHTPGEFRNIYVAGGNTFIHDIMDMCGFDNIFKNKSGYFQTHLEAILEQNPQVIFVTSQGKNDLFLPWNKLSDFNVNVINLNVDDFSRPSTRILRSIEILDKIYYEKFSSKNS